ncbi:MAG: hypothetical protein KJP11_09035, partial [Gammaproteobacteria bacterium]|nr:hypothetical protein [Gammaproteobacteria bacterium]
ALDNVNQQGTRGLERSLEQMRDLARELSHLRQQTSRGTAGRGQGAATSGGAGIDGDAIGREQLNDIAERTRELGDGLLDQGVAAGDIDPVLAQIEALTRAQNSEVIPASTSRYDDALRALMELEYRLRNELDEPEFPELLISEPTDLPDDYREMVADYFRKLSQQ